MAAASPDRTIIAGPFRTDWLRVFSPRKKEKNGQEVEEYEATLLIPKKGTPRYVEGELEKVLKAIRAAIADQFGASAVEQYMKAPANVFKMCLKDGDKETRADKEGNWVPKYPGYWFFGATENAKYALKLYNAHDRSPATEAHGWRSGDWAKAQLAFYAYNRPDAKGVSCGLRAMSFCYKDEPLGGGGVVVASADEFGDIKDADAPTGASAPRGYNREDDPFADG